MLRIFYIGLLTLTHLAISTTGYTEEAKPKTFTGEGGLGLIINSGNTENENLNGNLKAALVKGKWKHNFGLDIRRTTEDDETTAKRFLFTEKSDYNFSKKTYSFVALRYDDDRFSGFDYQASVSGGIGWHIIDNETHNLDLELGAGYKESKIDVTGEIEDESIGRLAGHYDKQLSANTVFSQDILVESGSENTSSDSVTALKVSMSDKLALQFTYTIKHNSDPPAGNESTDRTTAVTLVYGF